jgi:hypothetical protein
MRRRTGPRYIVVLKDLNYLAIVSNNSPALYAVGRRGVPVSLRRRLAAEDGCHCAIEA